MTVYGSILPGAGTIARSAALVEALTERAKQKIKVLDWYKGHGKNLSLTSRHFGMGRATLHRWLKRFNLYGVIGLNERSRKPKRVRKPTTAWDTVIRTVQLRKLYPAWSKYKLAALLKREGVDVSASTVGRILCKRGLIDKKVSQKRKRAALRPKARFPKGLSISGAGDLVQMDVKHILAPGAKYYQFTAIDVLTKTRVLRVYSSESSRNGAHFLTECILNFPFTIRAIQTDNGSSFLKEFDKACMARGITHYFAYPRNPKQQTYVEISHEADQREFYEQGNVCPALEAMRKKVSEWERVWNNVRPHQALGQLTPAEYLLKLQTTRIPTKNTIILQV